MLTPGSTYQLWISPGSLPDGKDELDENEEDEDNEDDVDNKINALGEIESDEKKQKKTTKLPPSLDLENANAMSPYLSLVPEGEWGLFCDHDGRIIAQQVELVFDKTLEPIEEDDLPVNDISSTPSTTRPNSPNADKIEDSSPNSNHDTKKKPGTVLLVSVGSPASSQDEDEDVASEAGEEDDDVAEDMSVDDSLKDLDEGISMATDAEDLALRDIADLDNDGDATSMLGTDSDRSAELELAEVRMLHDGVDLKGFPCVKNSWYVTKPAFDRDLVDEFTIINTAALAKDVRTFLKDTSIPLAGFSKQQLNRTQGTLSDLLNHPKEWTNLSGRGKDIYLKMMKFLSAPNLQDLVLKLRNPRMGKRVDAVVDIETGSIRPPNCLPDHFLLTLSKGEMPSQQLILATASLCMLDAMYLARHCVEQLKYLGLFQNGDHNDQVDAADTLPPSTDKQTVESGTQTTVTSSNLMKRASGLLPKFLERHICTHFGCGAILQSKPCFDSHSRCHTGVRKFRCSVCEKTFAARCNLNTHMKVHDINKISKREKDRMLLAADKTEDMYKTVHMTKQKKEILRQMKYICGLCWEGCPSRNRLINHLFSQHRVCERNVWVGYTCYACSKTFKSITSLVVHMRVHTNVRPFQCDVCKAGFQTKANLQRHSRTHTGEKPFSCNLCHATFTEAKSVAIHMRIHTGEKPYECRYCGKRFSQRSPLQVHLAIHEDKKHHLCDLCGQSFRQKVNLVSHMKRHMGVKKHKCSVCASSFFSKGDCTRHMQRHLNTNERKLFKCDSCKKVFTRPEHLRQHQKNHQDPLLKCKYCDKKFCNESDRKRHQRIKLPTDSLDSLEDDSCSAMASELIAVQPHEKGCEDSDSAENKSGQIYMAARALFGNQKHFIITAVSGFDNNTQERAGDGDVVDHQSGSGSIILTPVNQEGLPASLSSTHSVFLQGASLNGQQLTMCTPTDILPQHSILFTDDGTSVSDGSLRMSLGEDVGIMKDRRENMVEDSDPNMQSVVVETTEENIIISQDRVMTSDPDKQLKLGDAISAYQVIVPNATTDNNIIIAMEDDQQVGMGDTDLDTSTTPTHATLLGVAPTISQDQSVTEQQTDAKGQTYIVVDFTL